MGKSEKKGKKRKHGEEHVKDVSEHNDEEEPQPSKSRQIATADQMLEVVKIKSALEKSHESKRSKKRKRNVENAEQNRSRADKKYFEEIIEYLKLWETDRNVIVDDVWRTALDYLSGSQGKSKEELKGKAEEIIQKIDSKVENSNKMEQSLYKRAREMLQILD